MTKKNAKKSRLQTLPVDLSRMAGEPVDAVIARAEEAAAASVSVFDTRNAQNFVTSGKASAPMAHTVRASDSGVTIRLVVSSRPLSIRDLRVRPGLDSPTTGSRRTAVRVMGRVGREIEVPRGFIWNGSVFMRDAVGRKISNAKSFLIKSGADPSPARMLGESQDDVAAAALAVLSEAVDGVQSKNNQ